MSADLAEFLLARIAEDEAAARAAARLRTPAWRGAEPSPDYELNEWGTAELAAFGYRFDPARVLAECEAKRRIVEAHPIYRGSRTLAVDSSTTDYGCELCHCIDPIRADGIIEANGYCETLLALALPYADHPDYDEAWRL